MSTVDTLTGCLSVWLFCVGRDSVVIIEGLFYDVNYALLDMIISVLSLENNPIMSSGRIFVRFS